MINDLGADYVRDGLKFVFMPDIIPSGWLGSKHQLTINKLHTQKEKKPGKMKEKENEREREGKWRRKSEAGRVGKRETEIESKTETEKHPQAGDETNTKQQSLHWPFKVGDKLVVGLWADDNDLGQEFIAVVRPFRFVHVHHQFLYDLHQVLLGHHAIQEVKGTQSYGLVLVVQALQDQVLVTLHWFGVGGQDAWHGQQSQVLHWKWKTSFLHHPAVRWHLLSLRRETNHELGLKVTKQTETYAKLLVSSALSIDYALHLWSFLSDLCQFSRQLSIFCVLLVLPLPYWSFQLYISLWKSPSTLVVNWAQNTN